MVVRDFRFRVDKGFRDKVTDDLKSKIDSDADFSFADLLSGFLPRTRIRITYQLNDYVRRRFRERTLKTFGEVNDAFEDFTKEIEGKK